MKNAQNYLQRDWWFFALNEKYCTSVEFKKIAVFICSAANGNGSSIWIFWLWIFFWKNEKADNFQKKITTDTLLCITSIYWQLIALTHIINLYSRILILLSTIRVWYLNNMFFESLCKVKIFIYI